jgi:N-acetylated-alpha-linked acidic dipeptidase
MKFLAALLAAGIAATAQTPGIRGFAPTEVEAQLKREAQAKSLADSRKIRTYIERMSAEPHAAGSAESKKVAEYAAGLLREWGLNVEIEEFDSLLPYPTKRILEVTAPIKYKAKLQETVLPEDGDSRDKGQLPTYNAYSASGDVTAQVVYVNYGVPEDYEQLKRLGIDVKGKVVLARYGKSWRGTKPKVAAENGAIGCLIYSDPRDDGYFQGDVYPKGAFRPPQGVQRGSVVDMPLYVGDPLTPGWASEKGTRRLDRKDAKSLMTIPVLPISYEDARPILENLGGPVAPESWRGALPLTYHIGAGPATVRLALDFDWTSKPMYNVIATIPGSTFPDEWVIYGNHHDAWVNGASDPVSGAAALMEAARVLAELKKQGWAPKRTIKLALWDGEEFGLMGSTEWAEKHAAELSTKAVAYFNSDSNSRGPLGLAGSPSMLSFLRELTRDNVDPVTKQSLLTSSRARREEGRPAQNEFRIGPLGAGSDYVAFVHNLGITSANAGFSGGFGGVYHSIYDSFTWYSRFGDPDFLYGKALAEYMSTALLRFADASVVPLSFTDTERALRSYVEEATREATRGTPAPTAATSSGKSTEPNAANAQLNPNPARPTTGTTGSRPAPSLDFGPLRAELDLLKTAAASYESALSKALAANPQSATLASLNASIRASERALLVDGGLPGRPFYKYLVAAPGQYTGYGAITLPGVRESLMLNKVSEARQQVEATTKALAAYRQKVEEATKILGGM